MTAVAAPRNQADDRRGWFDRVREHVGLHTAVIALMVIWAIPTVALFINSVRPGDVASSSGWCPLSGCGTTSRATRRRATGF